MLAGSRFLVKQVETFPKIFISRPDVRHCSVPTPAVENVVIPPRIERGPTDILKALASTVGIDHTAFPYQFPDDPYFCPFSKEFQELNALSLEAGRKSARWIFNKNPAFFKNQLSDPPIEAFQVKPVVAASKKSEKALLEAIENRNVLKAIKIYKALEKEKKDVSESTKQLLLELTCFFNSQERKYLDVNEKWYRLEVVEEEEKNKWKSDGFAQKLFEKMDASCSLANSAIIQGMLKHDATALAWELYDAAKAKKLRLSVNVYNMLLSTTPNASQNVEYIEDILYEMSEKKIKPNLGTLNAVLKSMSESRVFRKKIDFTFEILAEFEKLGIQPSLGSYGYIFRILSNLILERKQCQSLSNQLMSKIENENFDIVDPADLKFFQNAVYAFCYKFSDPQLSLRLLDMYSRNNNAKFIVTSFTEWELFKNIFDVLLKTHPIESVMDFYRRYSFTTFVPSGVFLKRLISAIGENHASKYLPELWEDVKQSHFASSSSCLIAFLKLVTIFPDETSQKVIYSAAIAYLNLDKSRDPYFGENASNILIALANNGDEENITKLLNYMKNLPLVTINQGATTVLYNFGLAQRKIPILLESLKIAAEISHPKFCEMASEALPLLDGASKAWATELIEKEKEKGEGKRRKAAKEDR